MPLANNHLKDFQAATVDYVYEHFTDPESPCNRFLVADEVGLGKTMVARGVIQKLCAKAELEGKKEFRVVYFCSNQSIASQNINRLNIYADKSINSADIGRVNDLAIKDPDMISSGFLKIIPLSPNTSVKISRGGGVGYERAVLFHILKQNEALSEWREVLRRILRLDLNESDWDYLIDNNSWVSKDLREEIALQYNKNLNSSSYLLETLLAYCEGRSVSGVHYSPRRLIGELRKILAIVCVNYLKPDLVILDEFQRFKSILSSESESEERLITESLFNRESTKILLLSATPYKMYTIQSEDNQEESHFEEFTFIVNFLLNDAGMYTPMKLTMSGRSKLTTYFGGEEVMFMYDSVVNNFS